MLISSPFSPARSEAVSMSRKLDNTVQRVLPNFFSASSNCCHSASKHLTKAFKVHPFGAGVSPRRCSCLLLTMILWRLTSIVDFSTPFSISTGCVTNCRIKSWS
eukprot:Lithocolla_globosa_v1_NODE_167_length_5524_cov_11.838362.p5 type:complete len:104 gc:universal NODE_167_length_5524_cov_11.838362:3416-3727(+)